MEHYLFESRELRRVLNVAQVRVLRGQLLRDALVLWMLRSQDQVRVVAQLTEVLQRLKEDRGRIDNQERPLRSLMVLRTKCFFVALSNY